MTRAADAGTSGDEILTLERAALDRWGNGDPGGFLELYAPDITYFDPATEARLDGHQTMASYYQPWIGKIKIPRYEMLNPQVVVDGNLALLTYNLVNYITDAAGIQSEGARWNSTTVYQRRGGTWKAIHSHWSYTRHPAFQNMSPEASEARDGTPIGPGRKPNFSGDYMLNRSACTLSPGAAAVRSAVLHIDHQEPVVRLRAAFTFADHTFEFSLERVSNGREVIHHDDGSTAASLRWDGDTLLFVDRTVRPDSEVTMSWRYELDQSGQLLRADEQIRGGSHDQDNTWVFDRVG